MNAIQSNESFLLTQFREFYTEIIRLKRLIKDSEIPTIEAPAPEPAGNGNGSGNGNAIEHTGKLPTIDPALLQTWTGSEKLTALAVRGTVDPDREPTPEQSKLALLVWQNLIALFRRNAVQILRVAGKPTDNYFEAQYVMAAFASS